jgi:hypothetical protein
MKFTSSPPSHADLKLLIILPERRTPKKYTYCDSRFWLILGRALMVYAKARQQNLTAEEKKAVRKLAAILKS